MVCAIGDDDGEGGPGEFVGAVTVPVRRACCGEVEGGGVTVTAPQPRRAVHSGTVRAGSRATRVGPCHGDA